MLYLLPKLVIHEKLTCVSLWQRDVVKQLIYCTFLPHWSISPSTLNSGEKTYNLPSQSPPCDSQKQRLFWIFTGV